MKKKIPAILCTGLLIFAAAGCSGNTSNTASTPPDTTSATEDTLSQTVLTGEVTAIEDNNVTLALMAKDEASSVTSDVIGGNNQDLEAQTTPSAPAQTDGQSQDDLMPGYILTGETKTITVSSDTVITIDVEGQKTSGTVSDIAVGDYLTVTMTGTTVSAISIKNAIAPPATADGNIDSDSSPAAGASTQNSPAVSTHSNNTAGSKS